MSYYMQYSQVKTEKYIHCVQSSITGNMRAKTVLGGNSSFRTIYEELTNMYGRSPESTIDLTQAGRSQQVSF